MNSATLKALYNEDVKFKLTFSVGGTNLSYSDEKYSIPEETHYVGELVTVTAPWTQYELVRWSSNDITIVDPKANTFTFIMPPNNVKITANVKVLVFPLKVISELPNASGSGKYFAGTKINIYAGDDTDSKVFKKWTCYDGASPNTDNVRSQEYITSNKSVSLIVETNPRA